MILEDQIYHFMRGFGLQKTEARVIARGLAVMIKQDKESKEEEQPL